MNETSTELALPNVAMISADLLQRYGDDSHHKGVVRQARFESFDGDGRQYSVLLTQRGLGSSAVYKANVHEVLDSKYESIYTMQVGSQVVSSTLKSQGEIIGGEFEWPSSVGSNLLYGCYGNQRH